MEKEFVPLGLAVKLKELGFDERCLAYYNTNNKLKHSTDNYYSNFQVKSPLWQQGFDWFREEYNMPNWIYESVGRWYFKIVKEDFWIEHREIGHYKTYKEARKACLEKLIEILENEKS